MSDDIEALVPRVRAWLRRDFGTELEVDDTAQDALAALTQALPSFRGDSSLSTFAYRITRRVAIDKLRKRRRREALELDSLPDSYDLERRLTSRRALRRVQRVLDRLPDKRREAFVLCCIEGMAPSDAAERVGVSAETMRSRLRHARSEVMRRLAHDATLRIFMGLGLVLAAIIAWSVDVAPTAQAPLRLVQPPERLEVPVQELPETRRAAEPVRQPDNEVEPVSAAPSQPAVDWRARADEAAREGRWTAAARAYERAATIRRDPVSAYRGARAFLDRVGDPVAALRTLRRGASLPGSPVEYEALVLELELYDRLLRPVSRSTIERTLRERFPDSDAARALDHRIERIE